MFAALRRKIDGERAEAIFADGPPRSRNMSDLLVQFDEPQPSADGRIFIAQVMGSRLATGLWEAWIEFHPRVGGEPVRTGRETEQLSRGDLRFWAAGLTREYLQYALKRALDPEHATVAEDLPRELDVLASMEATVMETNSLRAATPVFDPIRVYQQSGEYTLRQELRALDARQLADIISAFSIADMDVVDLARTYEDALAERIVAGVQHSVERGHATTTPAASASRR